MKFRKAKKEEVFKGDIVYISKMDGNRAAKVIDSYYSKD